MPAPAVSEAQAALADKAIALHELTSSMVATLTARVVELEGALATYQTERDSGRDDRAMAMLNHAASLRRQLNEAQTTCVRLVSLATAAARAGL